MVNKKAKWLVYTVLVGLIPFLSRLIIFALASNRNLGLLLNPTDFVALGLVLHVSNINELEHAKLEEKSWKTIHNGLSIVFIASYSVIFAIAALENTVNPGTFDTSAVQFAPIILSIASLALSYSIYDRLSKAEAALEES